MSFEPQDLSLTEVMQSINRCAEAYHYVLAQLPPKSTHFEKLDNQRKASEAFLSHLPVLLGLESFQIYIACIAQGASIGAIDIADVGRYCHLAITAMSAWKLANLVVPAAQAARATPHPPLTQSNRSLSREDQEAAAQLPDRKTQNQHYKDLRQRGVPVPSEQALRDNPVVALHFCNMARDHAATLPPRDDGQERIRPEAPPERPASAA